MRMPENFEPRRHCGSESKRGSLNLNLPTLIYLLISHRAQAKKENSLRTRLEEDSRVVQDEDELSDDVDAWLYNA
jgi:hypothetical protein